MMFLLYVAAGCAILMLFVVVMIVYFLFRELRRFEEQQLYDCDRKEMNK